jgi:RND superfamily putative drug exporter
MGGPAGGEATVIGRTFAALCVRLRWPIAGFWLVAAVVLTMALPNLHEAQTGALGDLVPKDAEAIDAEVRSYELFDFPLLSRTVLVQRDDDGLTERDQSRLAGLTLGINQQRYPDLKGIAGALPLTNLVAAPPLSRERATTSLTYLFFDPKVESGDQRELIDGLLETRFGPDDSVGVTGPVPARAAQADVIEERLKWVELGTVLLVAFAVGVHFRSVLAPLLTLAVVGASYLVAIRVLAWIGMQLDISVPSEVGPVIVVLLFGIVTDYSIFFISRFRAKLGEGVRPQRAAEEATRQLMPIIVTAGLTIVLASVTLLVARVGFLQAFGPGIAIAVLVGLLVTVTLVPALLAIAGERLFWPGRPSTEPSSDETALGAKPAEVTIRASGVPYDRPARFRWVRAATRQPVVVTIACVAILLLAASGLARMDVGNPIIRGLPPGNDVREAYETAERGFTPGVLSPTVAVVERPGITGESEALGRLQNLIEQQDGVAAVAGPGQAPFRLAPGATLSRTGNAARYIIVLSGDPLGGPALETYRNLHGQMPAMMEAAGLPQAKASFAGDTALADETVGRTFDDLWRVAPLALLAVFGTLAVFLRALVAPLYLVAASVLALFAALGLTSFIFQGLLGRGEITYFVPFAGAVLLLSLGSDYNVFVTGRIWQEARRRPLAQAVAVGGARSAAPIAVAGLILAGSFALLLLVPVSSFQELACMMALGLLLDAFLVRTLLVPAMITWVGRISEWPGRGLRMRRRRRGPIGARRA